MRSADRGVPSPHAPAQSCHSRLRELDALLDRLRDARFGRGCRCPRCGAVRAHRWGTFAGRQRYRCVVCRRTFSDLTHTPAAYVKKLHLWPAYAMCLQHGLPIRLSAERVGVHPSTAFRWRHAILSGLRGADVERLGGRIEVASMTLPYSEKGKRRIPDCHPAPRSRRLDVAFRDHMANVVLACDRYGNVITRLVGVGRRRQVGSAQLEEALEGRLDDPISFCAMQLCRRSARALARRKGVPFERTVGLEVRHRRPAHVQNVWRYRVRIVDWLLRFRGVATKYLPNYLAWHRSVDRAWRKGFRVEALRWPVGDAYG